MASNLYDLSELIKSADKLGLSDVMLPFLLIFTVFFAFLQKTKILGEHQKSFNVVIALVIALSVVIPHATNAYPPGYDVIDMLNSALPNISIIVIAIMMVILLLGIWGADSYFRSNKVITGGVVAFAFIVVLLVFGGAAGWWSDEAYNMAINFLGADGVALVVMILVFGLIVWFITGDKQGISAQADMSKIHEGEKAKHG